MGAGRTPGLPEMDMQTPTDHPQALIFDMDGVLVSSERVHWKAYRATLATAGVDYSWDAYRDTGMGISRENVLMNILGPLEEQRLLELMQLKEDHVRVVLGEEGVQRVPGAREFVTAAATPSCLNPSPAAGMSSYPSRIRRPTWMPRQPWTSPRTAASPSRTRQPGSRRPTQRAWLSLPWPRHILPILSARQPPSLMGSKRSSSTASLADRGDRQRQPAQSRS